MRYLGWYFVCYGREKETNFERVRKFTFLRDYYTTKEMKKKKKMCEMLTWMGIKLTVTTVIIDTETNACWIQAILHPVVIANGLFYFFFFFIPTDFNYWSNFFFLGLYFYFYFLSSLMIIDLFCFTYLIAVETSYVTKNQKNNIR